MDWIKGKTTDELLELLQWVVDRQRYRLACRIEDGPNRSKDAAAEAAALAELSRRGL